jgi:3-oxoacyl-[acyl-carrier-protein] synthase I
MSSPVDATTWSPPLEVTVSICGVGARTSVGLTAEASAAAVRGSISGLVVHPVFVDHANEPVSFALDPAMDVDLPIEERILRMSESVAEEALSQAASTLPVPVDCCLVALPEPRRGIAADLELYVASALAESLGLRHESVRALSRGHAGGLMALQAATQMVSRGEAQVALVIGVDSYHDAATIESLDVRRRLMSELNRGGFPPGEAAGACLLVRGDAAERQGLRVLAQMRAAATAHDPHPLDSTEPCLGEGLTAALTSVIGCLDLPQELITASYCDLNGERYRNEEFVYTLLRIQEAFVNAHDYVSPADCWGDVGAASGPLFAVLAVASSLRGYAKGSRPVLWAGSDSGDRSALVLALEDN